MPLLVIVEIGMATGALTITIAKAQVTKPLRRLLERIRFLKEMLSCLYCTSHWTAAGMVGLVRPDLGFDTRAADLIVAWLATVAIAAVAMFLINWCHGSMQWSDDSH